MFSRGFFVSGKDDFDAGESFVVGRGQGGEFFFRNFTDGSGRPRGRFLVYAGCLERRIQRVFYMMAHVGRRKIAQHFAGFEFYDGVEVRRFVDFDFDVF